MGPDVLHARFGNGLRRSVSELSIYIGWDPREAAAFGVARHSILRRLNIPIPVRGLMLSELRASGLYTRPTERRSGPDGGSILWDVISDAPMATEHACARFLVPHLAKEGWALFVDGDVLARANIGPAFESLDPSKALYCVKHVLEPAEGVKMDGQAQTQYARKNWSSFVIWNVGHSANAALTVEMVNTVPGRDLHRFCWLEDDNLIGELGPEWNHLVGVTKSEAPPRLVHFTLGTPDMPEYENGPYADEWRAELARWVA